jgi:hypothetical protein
MVNDPMRRRAVSPEQQNWHGWAFRSSILTNEKGAMSKTRRNLIGSTGAANYCLRAPRISSALSDSLPFNEFPHSLTES